MQKIKISYKIKTKLIETLEKKENIEVLEKKSFIKSLFSSKEYPDIYFHSGILDDQAIDLIKNSKKTIVNCYSILQAILRKEKGLEGKIEVLFPSFSPNESLNKEVKKAFKEKYNINKKDKIILFTAKNLKSSGIKHFIDIVNEIRDDEIKIIIEGESKQIFNLKFQITKYDFQDRLIILEDYPNKDELFYVSDIFILPTENRSFSTNVLRAMYYKCAVFVSAINYANEVVDVFARIESSSDRSLFFKLDALLSNKDELKKIKKENKEIASDYTVEKSLEEFNKIVEFLN